MEEIKNTENHVFSLPDENLDWSMSEEGAQNDYDQALMDDQGKSWASRLEEYKAKREARLRASGVKQKIEDEKTIQAISKRIVRAAKEAGNVHHEALHEYTLKEREAAIKSAFLQKINSLTLRESGREYELTDNHRPIIDLLCKYFLRHPEFLDSDLFTTGNPSFHKGILLTGGYGFGKSIIMRTFSFILRSYPSLEPYPEQTPMRFLDVEQLCEMSENETEWRILKLGRHHTCIDDLGAEEREQLYRYKNPIRPLLRHLFNKPKADFKIMATTNLGPEELGKVYGGALFDRMMGCFNVIELKGQSMRG